MMARFASSASHPRDREASRRQGTSPCVGPRAELARRTTAAGKVRHGRAPRPCKHACSQRIEWYAEKRVGGALAPRLARCECEKCNFPFPHTTSAPIITETGLHARRLIRIDRSRDVHVAVRHGSRMHAAQAPLELGYTPHMRHTPPAAHGTSSGVSLDVTRRRKEHCH